MKISFINGGFKVYQSHLVLYRVIAIKSYFINLAYAFSRLLGGNIG